MTDAIDDFAEERMDRQKMIWGSMRLLAAIRSMGRPKPSYRPVRRNLRVEAILDATGMKEAVLGRSRKQPIASMRQAAMCAAYKEVQSLPEVGRCFGRDHTTVLHAWKKAHKDPDLMARAEELRGRLG